MNQIQYILTDHDLRSTQSRTEILEIFINQERALSQREIEDQMHSNCDRVTIYRTLTTFMEKGILHKVLDDSGAMKYALCASGCTHNHIHVHDHVHFKCNVCGETQCIEDTHFPSIVLPGGFDLQEINVLLQGLCPKCSSKGV